MIRLWAAGELPGPPIAQLTGMRYVEASDDGSGTIVMAASPWFCSRDPELQAGALAMFMYAALSAAPVSLASPGEYMGIVSQSLTFLDHVPADGRELIARYRLVHRGPLAVSAVEVVDADGNRVGLGNQTSVIRPRRRRGPPAQHAERILATVLFTDIVGSTERAEELGDEPWRELLGEYENIVRTRLETFAGREVKTLGDGFLATFESPARAVQCARAIRDDLRRLGVEIRAGIHTGECERVGNDLAGIAVHAAARIQSTAEPGEILVSSTVQDLVAGSGLTFADRGLHDLKGISGRRQLFAVAG